MHAKKFKVLYMSKPKHISQTIHYLGFIFCTKKIKKIKGLKEQLN